MVNKQIIPVNMDHPAYYSVHNLTKKAFPDYVAEIDLCFSRRKTIVLAALEGEISRGGIIGSKGKENLGYIDFIACKPSVRGKGVGTKLLDAFEKHMLQEYNCNTLEIDSLFNRRGWFNKQGYYETGEESGQTNVNMRKKLIHS
jgi:GNAT superfamily N-acetyltransferase